MAETTLSRRLPHGYSTANAATWLLVLLGVLFVLDAISTAAGLHHGLVENNPYARTMFDTHGPAVAIPAVTVGKIIILLALNTIAKNLPYGNGYRLVTYFVLTLVHVQVVGSNISLLV